MDYEKVYMQEVKLYIRVIKRFEILQENNIKEAYELMRDSLQAYNRWSKIKYDIKKGSGRGEHTVIKNRIEEMCRYLREVSTTSRMIWSRAHDDLRACREDF